MFSKVFIGYILFHLFQNGYGWTYDKTTKTVLDKSTSMAYRVKAFISAVLQDQTDWKHFASSLPFPDSDSVNMIVMGDWGGLPVPPYYSPFEKATAVAMMNYAQAENIDFLLALGDNFYYDGVVNEYDARFKTTFEDVFNDPNFLHVPWYILAGNHDHNGNITGEIAYSRHSNRWRYPDLWYAINVTRPHLNMTIVMIDTVTLCGNTLSDDEGSQPDGNIDLIAEAEQLHFIESKLKDNKDQYVMVAGHFPVWSVAEHGPTKCLIDKLKPLLEKYNANAYLSGHDHNLQHIRQSTSAVDYFVSGAVDVVDPNMKHENSIPNDSLQFHWANILGLGGFATIKATNESMAFTFNSATGSLLYRHQMKPRK